MTITAQMVKDLREKTGAGMMDCKAALQETDGDMEAAVDWLRTKGLAKAAKKAGRVAAEGLIAIAEGDRRAAIVELNSETDFVSRNEQFQDLVKAVASRSAEDRRQAGIGARREDRWREDRRERDHRCGGDDRREHDASPRGGAFGRGGRRRELCPRGDRPRPRQDRGDRRAEVVGR